MQYLNAFGGLILWVLFCVSLKVPIYLVVWGVVCFRVAAGCGGWYVAQGLVLICFSCLFACERLRV